MEAGQSGPKSLLLGRYRVHDEIAAGGMATVHLGRLLGDAGFARTVAIKRLHPWHAKVPDVVAMFTDEARIAARIRHPNVVTTLDVVSQGGEVFLVMEYVHGEPLSRLIVAASKRKQKIPPKIVATILANALYGLHAAHEAKDARGKPLGVVHRDVSPQNVLVGVDGVGRVLDFGIARAAGRAHVTGDGTLKGKLAYMSPEQLRGESMDRRSDVFAAGVVLWEALTCRRLFSGATDDLALQRIFEADVDAPSKRVPDLPAAFDEITLRALRKNADERFPTARDMAVALEGTGPLASPLEVATWVEELASEALAERARIIEGIEDGERRTSLPPAPMLASAMAEAASATGAADKRHAAAEDTKIERKPQATKAPIEVESKATQEPEVVGTVRMMAPSAVVPSPVARPEHRVEATIKMSTSDVFAAPVLPPPGPMEHVPFDEATTAPLLGPSPMLSLDPAPPNATSSGSFAAPSPRRRRMATVPLPRDPIEPQPSAALSEVPTPSAIESPAEKKSTRRTKRSMALLALVAFVFAVAIGLMAGLVLQTRAPADAPLPPAPPPPLAPESAAPPATVAPATPPADDTKKDEAVTAPATSASAENATPLDSASAAPSRSPSQPRLTTPKGGCNPPFFYDAAGHKKYKRGCI